MQTNVSSFLNMCVLPHHTAADVINLIKVYIPLIHCFKIAEGKKIK